MAAGVRVSQPYRDMAAGVRVQHQLRQTSLPQLPPSASVMCWHPASVGRPQSLSVEAAERREGGSEASRGFRGAGHLSFISGHRPSVEDEYINGPNMHVVTGNGEESLCHPL